MAEAPTSIEKVLLLGSGALKIGQAGEFDYSGSQAIKALKEANIEVILVNPNIATVQTNQDMADEVYFQPLTVPTVENIIEREQPNAIILSFGGQTALNLGLELAKLGILDKHNVKVLGNSIETITTTEDRALFKEALAEINILTAKSICVDNVTDALTASEELGFPMMMRAGFSLGGLGSCFVHNVEELKERAHLTLSVAPQILLEECLTGWCEFEYEIVRDIAGNCLCICNMENLDPMGVHTGESIVIAPSQSLDNHEYHMLRKISIDVAHHMKIIGECNIQFAYNLKTSEYRVIEMNPRLSRSSALASKATGYPLAFIATKLLLGHKLHEIKNSVTQKTCAFFEPALDYVVVKIPRWDLQKLSGAEHRIGTEMKSVGEVMAIGRSFTETLQKAIGMLNIGVADLADYHQPIDDLKDEVEFATDRRIFALYRFFIQGNSIEEAHELSKIDKWFLNQIKTIADFATTIKGSKLTSETLLQAKQLGFSDHTLGELTEQSERDIRHLRIKNNIIPYIKQVDTLAGEFEAETNYLYLTYHGTEHDIDPSTNPATIIIGSGPYCIGSSVEFDWSAVTTATTLKHLGETSVLINSNPETVSTDYDESDRLYFEQLSFERVQDIVDFENSKGIIVSVGGQIANNLVGPLSEANYTILGTPPKYIDQAENREKFSSLLNTLNIDQPAWISATDIVKAKAFAKDVSYPVLIRPSFVLSGAAMKVVFDENGLEKYLKQASLVSPKHPVVISKFIEDAKELEMDCVAQNGKIIIDVISEHIEKAGVHSGDATIVTPPQRLYLETIRRAKNITRKIAKALNVTGPMNLQLLAKDNDLKVIECNLRASRSFPFVSKVTNHNLIEISTRAIMDEYTPRFIETLELDYVGVKSPQFSYNRLKGANPIAHVEMASTGEVACIGEDLNDAFLRSWLAADNEIKGKRIFVSIWHERRSKLLEEIRKLDEMNWEIHATEGTNEYLAKQGIGSYCIYKASEMIEPNVTTLISDHKIDLIINISSPHSTHKQQSDGFMLRRLAIEHGIPLITNLQIAERLLICLAQLDPNNLPAKSLNDFINPTVKEEIYQ